MFFCNIQDRFAMLSILSLLSIDGADDSSSQRDRPRIGQSLPVQEARYLFPCSSTQYRPSQIG